MGSNNSSNNNLLFHNYNNKYEKFLKKVNIEKKSDVHNIIDENNLLYFKCNERSIYIYRYDCKSKTNKLIELSKFMFKNINLSKMIKIIRNYLIIPDYYSLKVMKFEDNKLNLINRIKLNIKNEFISNILSISYFKNSIYLLTYDFENKYRLFINNNEIKINITYDKKYYHIFSDDHKILYIEDDSNRFCYLIETNKLIQTKLYEICYDDKKFRLQKDYETNWNGIININHDGYIVCINKIKNINIYCEYDYYLIFSRSKTLDVHIVYGNMYDYKSHKLDFGQKINNLIQKDNNIYFMINNNEFYKFDLLYLGLILQIDIQINMMVDEINERYQSFNSKNNNILLLRYDENDIELSIDNILNFFFRTNMKNKIDVYFNINKIFFDNNNSFHIFTFLLLNKIDIDNILSNIDKNEDIKNDMKELFDHIIFYSTIIINSVDDNDDDYMIIRMYIAYLIFSLMIRYFNQYGIDEEIEEKCYPYILTFADI